MNNQVFTIPKLKRPRQAKNWLHVNIGARDAKQLRALAECLGMDLRGFLRFAINDYQREHGAQIKREFGVDPWEVDKISRARRLAIGAARRAIWTTLRNYGGFPDRN